MKRTPLALLLLFAAVTTAPAATWFLEADGSGDAPDIQAAIDSAAPGDTILLNDGVFSGVGNQFFVVGKTLTFLSVNGPDFTRIFFINTPGFVINAPNCVVEGIVLDRAAGSGNGGFGGAIWVKSADFTIRNCVLVDCSALAGGGIAFWQASGYGHIIDCVIRDCKAESLGGAVIAFSGMSEILIDGCLITACNMSPVATQAGNLIVRNTTFYDNEDGGGGGSAVSFGGPLTMENCIIANSVSKTHPPLLGGTGSLSISCTDIFGNTKNGADVDWVGDAAPFANINGNFSEDPLFCQPQFGIFTLMANSPCAPGNHPTGAGCGLVGAYDVDCGGSTATEEASWSDFKEMFR